MDTNKIATATATPSPPTVYARGGWWWWIGEAYTEYGPCVSEALHGWTRANLGGVAGCRTERDVGGRRESPPCPSRCRARREGMTMTTRPLGPPASASSAAPRS